jgi:ABC-type transport system involved in multi-copper enzyme maturation permease subunit
MRQFVTIAANAFMELVRQPIFLLLLTASGVFGVFLAVVPYFGFGDDLKMVKDSVLAVTLLAGLIGAVLGASASLAQEIRGGTALAVLAKPVSRAQFILAKYAGVAGALTLLTYFNTLSALLASRMAYDAYNSVDSSSLTIYVLAVVLAYGVAAFQNYFLERAFVPNAVFALTLLVTLAVFYIGLFTTRDLSFIGKAAVDWRLVPAAVLILFALWILAGVALACSTRLEMIPTLAICSAIFLLGLMSDYLFGTRAEPVWTENLTLEMSRPDRTEAQRQLLKEVADRYDANHDGWLETAELNQVSAADIQRMTQAGLGGVWWARVLYAVTPNWQLFWMADAIDNEKSVPWSYVGRALGYVAGYLGASLVVALLLFEDRELS